MKKFKTRKEILENPEFEKLLFELLKEEGYDRMSFDPTKKGGSDDQIEARIDFFIERKIKQCVMQGV